MAGLSVDAVLARLGPDQRAAINELRAIVHKAAPQLNEAIKWNQLRLLDAQGKAVLALIPHRQHANLQLFLAAGLVERFPQLEGTGKGARHMKCRYDTPIDEKLVVAIVRAAVRMWNAQAKSKAR